MNSSTFMSPKVFAGAALVGLVGAAGVFIYEQVYAEKRRVMLAREVQRLDKQMANMRMELESLKDLQKETHLKRQKHKRLRREATKPAKTASTPTPTAAAGDVVDSHDHSYASDAEYFTDYQSVVGTDAEMDSEEFYDVHTDEEDDTLRETPNGHAVFDEDMSEKSETTPKETPKESLKDST